MSAYKIRKLLLPLARKIIISLHQEVDLNEKKLQLIRNSLTSKGGGVLPKNLELIEAYRTLVDAKKITPAPHLLSLIQKRKVRTLSGIANITVLTPDFGCPGRCIYCPTEKGMPKSYLSNEPAMMRAVQNEFDAYRQVKARLKGLLAQGHDVSKIDIRIAGGTWSAIPHGHQIIFLCGIFRALNEGVDGPRNPKSETLNPKQIPNIPNSKLQTKLNTLIKQNEKAKCRCVGLWIETRPDWINMEEIKRLRSYGVTGVEMGIQTTDDKVNEFCQRGHGLVESVRATQLLRDAGLKVCHHLMPNLPTATLKSDLKSGRDLFKNEGLRPDYLKIYPMVVTPYSPLAKMLKKDPALHKPYSQTELMELIAEIKKGIPEYCRVIRIVRDIPDESVVMGNATTNLRQLIQNKGAICRCVRCREINDLRFTINDSRLKIQKYITIGGEEVFITIEIPKIDKLVALCRLRLPDKTNPFDRATQADRAGKPIFKCLKDAAIVRELHVYGRQESLEKGMGVKSHSQHLGFGRQLMARAEKIAKKAGFAKIAVIAAIGTREYYRKLGYRLEETYMTKSLK